MKNKPEGLEQKLRNSGAQEVEALRKPTGTKKGTAARGSDLRNGK